MFHFTSGMFFRFTSPHSRISPRGPATLKTIPLEPQSSHKTHAAGHEARPRVSVIIPLFNEAGNIRPLHERISQSLSSLGLDFEVVYVDDRSEDETIQCLREIAEVDPRTVVVGLSTHCGQTLAIRAGIEQAGGEILILMDGDLQNDPRDIPRLIEKLEEGYDVVSGWRRKRHDPLWHRRIPSWVANRLIARMTGVRLHDFGCSLKAYRRTVLEGIPLYGGIHRILPVYAAMQGARITEVEVNHNPRVWGVSHYGWRRTGQVILDLFVARFLERYSTKPIYFFGQFGLWMVFIGALAGAWVVVRCLFFGGIWMSPLLFVSLCCVFLAFQFLLLGLLAELLIRIYFASAGRSPYQIRVLLAKGRDVRQAP